MELYRNRRRLAVIVVTAAIGILAVHAVTGRLPFPVPGRSASLLTGDAGQNSPGDTNQTNTSGGGSTTRAATSSDNRAQHLAFKDSHDGSQDREAPRDQTPIASHALVQQYSKNFLFSLPRIESMYISVEAGRPGGRVSDAPESRVWLIMYGHLRTFELNLPNLFSFIEHIKASSTASRMEVFTLLCVWSEVESHSAAWWKTNETEVATKVFLDTYGNVSSILERSRKQFSERSLPFSYIVADPEAPNKWFGQYSALRKLIDISAFHWGVRKSLEDLVIKSTPDILFEQSVSAARLTSFLNQQPLLTIFFLSFDSSHKYDSCGRPFLKTTDPADIVHFSSLAGLDHIVETIHTMSFVPESDRCSSLNEDSLYFYPRIFFLCSQFQSVIVKNAFRIHAHRTSGSTYNAWPNPPFNVFPPDSKVRETIDLTTDLLCTVPPQGDELVYSPPDTPLCRVKELEVLTGQIVKKCEDE